MTPLFSATPRPRLTPSFPPLTMHRAQILLCCLLMLLLTQCSTGKEGDPKRGQKTKTAVPVAIATSSKKTVPVELGATGHVEASATAEIRSQITGILKLVHFKEGEEVKAGDLLFTIDPRPFAANLAKAEAGLAKSKAELDNARREADRYALAAQKGYVSVEQADQAATRVTTLMATVKADQAAIDTARLELEYCSIRAPFAGRTGELTSDQGNLIKANADNPMVIINQVRPVQAAFTIPGQHLQEVFRYRSSGELKVSAAVKDSPLPPIAGTLVFIDNTVDPTTGVIRIKASFANNEHRLWPGQLLDLRLRLTERTDCIVVPAQAVQVGQKGAYVYVVKSDSTVAYRQVTTDMLYQGEVVIEDGLQEGEPVVIDGQMQLADGVKVEDKGRASTSSQKQDAPQAAEKARSAS